MPSWRDSSIGIVTFGLKQKNDEGKPDKNPLFRFAVLWQVPSSEPRTHYSIIPSFQYSTLLHIRGIERGDHDMSGHYKRVLILADIEGSSGCWSHRASSFRTEEWARACLEMTRDINAVVQALGDSGLELIRIKDFHRTGYNLIPELIDSRAEIIQGYRAGPVPGIGDPGDASGTPGFLAHTLTSRIAQLEMNGEILPEIKLFASSLAPRGIRPIFFSGCPVACSQTRDSIPGISVYPIEKSAGRSRFNIMDWRSGLQKAAVKALENNRTAPYLPTGPMNIIVKMRDGAGIAKKIATRWGLTYREDQIVFDADDMHEVYMHLIRICYLTPAIEKTMPLALWLYSGIGRLGLAWVRRQLKRIEKKSFDSFG
jgi:D-aminopeptidase